jgi:hypothetical protein
MNEWREVRLGELCDIYDGPHATPPKLDTGLIFLGISSLGFNGRIDPMHFEYVSEKNYKKWIRRIEPKYQDIVFSYETKLGVAAITSLFQEIMDGKIVHAVQPNLSLGEIGNTSLMFSPDSTLCEFEKAVKPIF